MLILFFLTLFADGETATAASFTIVGFLSMVFSGLFAWLTARDKLRFDAEKKELEKQIAVLKAITDECHRDRDETKADLERAMKRIDKLETEAEILRKRADDRSGVHTALPES